MLIVSEDEEKGEKILSDLQSNNDFDEEQRESIFRSR